MCLCVCVQIYTHTHKQPKQTNTHRDKTTHAITHTRIHKSLQHKAACLDVVQRAGECIWCMWRVDVYEHICAFSDNYVHANNKTKYCLKPYIAIHPYGTSCIHQAVQPQQITQSRNHTITQTSSARTNHHPPLPQSQPTTHCLSHVPDLKIRCLHCS